MGLEADSVPFQERKEARLELVRKHKATLVTLVGEFHRHHQDTVGGKGVVSSPEKYQEASTNVAQEEEECELPLSASCSTVCSIASELMRHILGMDLYDGGKLVAEAVSLYLKRAGRFAGQAKASGK